jgi:drug/metabolite transporter (DMT)-like permease
MLFLVAMASVQGGYKQIASTRPWYQFFYGTLTAIATYGSIMGVIYLSLADFYTIVFIAPLISTILAALFLKEKARPRIWLATLFGFMGVIVAVRFADTTAHALSWIGIMVSALSALTYSVSVLMVKNAPGENNYALNFWARVLGLIVAVVFLLCQKGGHSWDHIAVIYAVLSGVMTGLGGLLTNLSLRYAPIAVVSPYHYTQIIGGALIGYLIWHHIPAPSVVIGAAMVAASGIYILRRQRLSAETLFAETV